jgi:hypothetical protein
MTQATAHKVSRACGAPCCGAELDTSLLRIGGGCAISGVPSFALLDVEWESRTVRIRILHADGRGTVSVVDPDSPVSLDFTIDFQVCMDG